MVDMPRFCMIQIFRRSLTFYYIFDIKLKELRGQGLNNCLFMVWRLLIGSMNISQQRRKVATTEQKVFC